MERYGKSHMLGGIAMTKVENAALWNQRRSPKWEPTSYCYVQPRTDVVVLEDPNDNLNNVGPRLQYGAECNRLGNGSVLWVKADPNSAAWARLYAYLGRPPVVRVNEAELPKRPKGVKGATSRPKTMMKTVKFSSYAEQDTLVDAQASHFYVRKDRNLYKRPGVGDTRSLTNIIDLRNQLVSLGFMAETDEIIIVPGTHKKKVERPNWKCLYTFAARMVDEKMNVREINRGLALELYLNSLCDVGEYLKHRLARPEPMTYAPGSAAANYAAHIADCQRRFARRDMQGKLRTLATTLRHPKNMEIKVGRDIDDTPFQVAFADAYPLVHDHMKYASTNASAVNDDMITKVDRTINALDLLAAQAQGGTDDAQSADIAA